MGTCSKCAGELHQMPGGGLRCKPCSNAHRNEYRRLKRVARDANKPPFPPPFPVVEGLRFSLVPGYPGYAATDDGYAWSCHRWRTNRCGQWRRLDGDIGTRGYPRVTIKCPDGKLKPVDVHRLVLLAFRGEPPADKPCCCHHDDVRTNNNLENLRWGSVQDNTDDRWRNVIQADEPNGAAILSPSDVIRIRELHRNGVRIKSLMQQFEVCRATIDDIVAFRSWKNIA